MLMVGLFQCQGLTSLDGHEHRRAMSKLGAEAWWRTGIFLFSVIIAVTKFTKLT